MPDLTEVELAWLAGLLEDEGSFQAKPSIQVRVAMCDRDVVNRAAKLMGGNGRVREFRRAVWKPQHNTTRKFAVCGPHAAELMHLVRPWLGTCRRAQADAALERYDA